MIKMLLVGSTFKFAFWNFLDFFFFLDMQLEESVNAEPVNVFLHL